MVNYQAARVKLMNTQLNNLKTTGKSKKGIMLRLNKRKIDMKNCHMHYF